jgi:organic radical activating enzyme
MNLDKPDNKTYCPVMFDTIYSSNNSDVYNLCCYANNGCELDQKYKQSTHTPFEFFLSSEMDDLRNKVLNGVKIEQCSRCYKEEDTYGYSSRTRYLEQYENGKGYFPTEVGRIDFKLRHFGNYCNLSCVMCNPWNSTTRARELKDSNTEAYVTPGYREFYYENLNYNSYQRFKKSIIENVHLIDSFLITGGEPLQMPKVWEFLMKDIPKEHAKNISLVFDTNLTKLQYKEYDFTDLVARYKTAKLNVSCDNVGAKLSFQRYPIDVDEFENNLMTYNKHIHRIQCSVSLLNVFDLDHIYKYYQDTFRLGVSSNSYVLGPAILSVKNFKSGVKKELIEHYEHLNTHDKLFFNELKKEPDVKLKGKTVEYLDKLSKFRNMDWRKIWGDRVIESLA